jgi:hypothetical protein
MKNCHGILLVSMLASMVGCAAYMRVMTPKPRTVDNPLVSGQPLVVTSKADVGTVQEQDCNTWPFEDTQTVTMTASQICVEQHKNMSAPAGWSGEPTADSSKNVGVGTNVGADSTIIAPKSHSAKVGSCFNKGFNEQVAIWSFDYKGCTANNNLVTESTTSVHAGSESWQFTGAAAPAGAPASSASPNAPTAAAN